MSEKAIFDVPFSLDDALQAMFCRDEDLTRPPVFFLASSLESGEPLRLLFMESISMSMDPISELLAIFCQQSTL